jgi:cbb3-type cytochrome oxidase maturation protein
LRTVRIGAGRVTVESLYLLIPLSIALVLLIGAVLAWAALSGQFENLEAEGKRILDERRLDTEKVEHPAPDSAAGIRQQ